MYNVIPLFKSHFSLGKSILTLEKPAKEPNHYPISIFDLLTLNKLETLVLVEDNVSGLLQASNNAYENKIKLIFGLRLNICDDASVKDEASFLRRAKYIIFSKNSEGYKALISIWSFAAKDGFYYVPNIDFKTLKSFWNNNLLLAVPFYDSFLHLNALHGHVHIPELLSFGDISFFVEDNDLPFDELLKQKVQQYCTHNNYSTILPAQSIFYAHAKDFLAYLAFRCLHNRGTSQKCTLERPELNHMHSSHFNFNDWLQKGTKA